MRWSRRGSEGGSVIVEAAIVFPLLFLMVFGAIEYGLLFKDDLTGSNVVRAGGRVISAQANSPLADQAALQAMLPAAEALDGGLASVSRVVIYNASCAEPDATANPCAGDPPIKNVSEMVSAGDCVDPGGSNGVTGRCNVYTSSQLNQVDVNQTTNFGCGSGDRDKPWCPTSRVVSQAAGTDYIGVHIEYTHRWATGLFGTQRRMTDDVVFRLEPQAV